MNLAKLMLLQAPGIDSLTAFPTTASANISGAGTATSSSVTAMPRGGAGDFTYAWTCTGSITVTSPTSAMTTFSKSLSSGGTASGTATCTVTAVANGDKLSVDVAVSLVSTVSALTGYVDSAASGTGNAHTAVLVTSNSVSAIASGGTPGYSYSWSCTGGITVDSPSSATTTFSATVIPQGGTSGTATCTISDSASGTFDVSTSVGLGNAGFPTLSASIGGSASGSAASGSTVNVTSNSVTCTPSGGQTPDGFSWSCTGSISADNPSSATTTFSKLLGPGGSASGTATCSVSSADGQSTSATCGVSLANTGSSLSVSVDDGGPFGSDPSNTSATVTTNLVHATGHGGSGSYSYSWARIDGDSRIAATNPSGSATAFQSTSMPSNSELSATFRVTVSDGVTSVTEDVFATLTRGSP